MKTNATFENLIPALTNEEYTLLEANCIANGVQDSIKTWNGFIVDGHNREAISIEHDLAVKYEELFFKNENEVCIWIIGNQLGRRNIAYYVKFELVTKKFEYLKIEAKKNLSTGGGKHQPLTTVVKGSINVREAIAAETGKSQGWVEQAQDVLNFADEDTKEKIRTGELSMHEVYVKVKKEKDNSPEGKEKKAQVKQKKLETIKNTLPKQAFPIVLADPPWRYDFSIDDADKIENHYPTMDVEEIKAMEIKTSADAVLFLWATAPKLKEALEVMESWGFTYKTHAIWDKEWIGMGYWFRGQHELLLVGTKGKFPPLLPESSVHSEKRTEHSKKPDYYYELIEKSYPDMPKLELFARNKRTGWSSWGNQVEGNE